MKTVYVVFCWSDDTQPYLSGIFETKADAIAASVPDDFALKSGICYSWEEWEVL